LSLRIIVDLTHNEAIEEFPEIELEDIDIEVDYIEAGRISFDDLEDYDVFCILNIQHEENRTNDKLAPDELKAIKRYVGEGGGFLLTSGAGGDRDFSMKQGSIRVLYKITGVKRFWNGVIQEATSNFMVKKKNLLVTEFFTHPITKGVTQLVFPNCTFFTMDEDVDDIIVTSDKADFKYFIDDQINSVGTVPICVASEFHDGRTVTVGSSDFLLDDSDFGLDAGDNQRFLQNIINWLTFEI